MPTARVVLFGYYRDLAIQKLPEERQKLIKLSIENEEKEIMEKINKDRSEHVPQIVVRTREEQDAIDEELKKEGKFYQPEVRQLTQEEDKRLEELKQKVQDLRSQGKLEEAIELLESSVVCKPKQEGPKVQAVQTKTKDFEKKVSEMKSKIKKKTTEEQMPQMKKESYLLE